MTAIASGCSISEPTAKCKGQRKHSENRRQRGHEDGPETPAARNDQCFGHIAGLREIFIHCIKHQNAVFRDDADNHYHSHQADDIKSRIGNKQGEEHAAQRQHRAGNDRDGSANERNSTSKTRNTRTIARIRATSSSRNDACCSA